MSVLVQNLQRVVPVDVLLLRSKISFLRAALCHGRFSSHDVGVVLCTDSRMRSLNYDHRRLAKPTDILSFRRDDNLHPHIKLRSDSQSSTSDTFPENPVYIDPETGQQTVRPVQFPDDLGDIMLNVQYCRRTALSYGWLLDNYLPVVLTHGLAHLMGFTHETPEAYASMKAAEEGALRKLAGEQSKSRGADKFFLDGTSPQSYLP